MRRQVENPNPYIPLHLRFRQQPIEVRERLEQQWRRRRWTKLVPIFFLLITLVVATRMARIFLSRCRQNHSDFVQGVSLTSNSDSLVSDGRCKQHTSPRAFVTCLTRKFYRRVHVAQDVRGILLKAICVFLNNSFHLIHVSPHLA